MLDCGRQMVVVAIDNGFVKALTSESSLPSGKFCILNKNVDKWIVENDKDLHTSIWLNYNVPTREHVKCLSMKCSV